MAPVSTNRCPSTDGAKIQTLRLLMLQQICQDILEKQSAAFVRRIDPPMVGGLDRKWFQSSNFSSSNQPFVREWETKNYTVCIGTWLSSARVIFFKLLYVGMVVEVDINQSTHNLRAQKSLHLKLTEKTLR